MTRNFTYIITFLFIFLFTDLFGQEQDKVQNIQSQLSTLSQTVPGLNQRVQLSVTGVSIQEFLRALAQSNNLNINIDPSLNLKIYNNFNNETALNILVFLAKEYNLAMSFSGSIMNISPGSMGNDFLLRNIKIQYNQGSNALSLELDNDSLPAVARKITQLTQKNIVVPSTLLKKKISAFFTDVEFDRALESMAFANDFKVVKSSDNMYVFQPLNQDEEVYVNPEKNPSVRKTIKPDTGQEGTLGISTRSMVNGQTLITADAVNVPIINLIRAASRDLNKNYFLYSDIQGTISTNVTDISYDNFLSSLLQGTDYTYKIENGIYLIGERKLEGLRTNRVIKLQNRSIDSIRMLIPNEWRKGVEIREFREQNTLLLSGSGPQIAEIEAFITQLDQLVPLILIEVTLIDVRKNRNVKTGIRAGISDSVKTGGTILPGIDYTLGSRSINDFLARVGGIGSINLGRVTPNFYLGLSALEENNNVDVRSVPKLSTLNGHTATLSIGSTRYYVTKTQNVFPALGSPTTIFTEQFNKVEANLAINIRPIVSGDDQVTLNIKVDIADFIGIPPDNAPPPTSNSRFESIIRARNEDMIVLGGLERTEKSEGGAGVPLLSRIPGLKWLFSSKTNSTSKVVTIVFIKPTIVR